MIWVMIAFAGFSITGCNRSTPEAANKMDSTSPIEQMGGTEMAGNKDFPAGYQPAFDYRIRSQRTDTVNGEQFRKLVIEFKGGDEKAIDAAIQSGLERLGYRRYKTINEPNGAIVGDYGRDGHRITATTTPIRPEMELMDPEANGTVYFVWKP